jgi:hypothetical protein
MSLWKIAQNVAQDIFVKINHEECSPKWGPLLHFLTAQSKQSPNLVALFAKIRPIWSPCWQKFAQSGHPVDINSPNMVTLFAKIRPIWSPCLQKFAQSGHPVCKNSPNLVTLTECGSSSSRMRDKCQIVRLCTRTCSAQLIGRASIDIWVLCK